MDEIYMPMDYKCVECKFTITESHALTTNERRIEFDGYAVPEIIASLARAIDGEKRRGGEEEADDEEDSQD